MFAYDLSQVAFATSKSILYQINDVTSGATEVYQELHLEAENIHHLAPFTHFITDLIESFDT
jgi:hypothetical protein